MDEGIEDIGVSGPEGAGIGCPGWEDEVTGVATRDFVEESRRVGDGFGPGFAGGDFGENGLDAGLVFEFSAEARDFAVEDFGADAELLGFVKADAIVLCQGQFCQTSEDDIVFVFDEVTLGGADSSPQPSPRARRRGGGHFRFSILEFRFGDTKDLRRDLKETWFRSGR